MKDPKVGDVMVLVSMAGAFVSCLGLGGLVGGFWGAIFMVLPGILCSVYVAGFVLEKVKD